MAAVANINVTIRPKLTKFYIDGDMWDLIRENVVRDSNGIPTDIVSADPVSGRLMIWIASSPLTVVDDEEE